MKKPTARNFDHVVLPVPDLEVARNRLSRLGFTVAPDARHKFGTENACVFFENGTFIEPLAIGQRETVEDAIQEGNNFLRRDAAFRFRNGEDGFSMLVFGDPNPKKQRKKIKKAGYETGKLVTVKRPGVKVRIAFAIDERSPDFSIFLCERPDGPSKFSSEFVGHENTAKAISTIYLHEQLPEDFQYYLQMITAQREVRSHSFGMEMKLPNATLSVLNADGMKRYLGMNELPQARGLRALAFEVTVADLQATIKVLEKNNITYRKTGNRIFVDAASGQGALIAFVEG